MRNQRLNAPQEHPPARIWQIWAGLHRAPDHRVGELPRRRMSSLWEATVKACGVAVAMVQGHSWVPIPPIDRMVNVGTRPPIPARGLGSQPGMGGKVRRRLMSVVEGGGPVVVRGRESRLHGEGVQCCSQ